MTQYNEGEVLAILEVLDKAKTAAFNLRADAEAKGKNINAPEYNKAFNLGAAFAAGEMVKRLYGLEASLQAIIAEQYKKVPDYSNNSENFVDTNSGQVWPTN